MAPSEDPAPLEVLEQGFSVFDQATDVASYAAILRNPNTSWAARVVELEVDFYDADEAFIAGEEPVVNVLPGQTAAVAGQAFGAGRTERIEVNVPEDLSGFLPSDEDGRLTVADVETEAWDGGCVTTGTLSSTFATPKTFVQLAAVYRDATTAIVGGASGGVDTVPAGGTASFEIAEGVPCDGIVETEVYWQVNP